MTYCSALVARLAAKVSKAFSIKPNTAAATSTIMISSSFTTTATALVKPSSSARSTTHESIITKTKMVGSEWLTLKFDWTTAHGHPALWLGSFNLRYLRIDYTGFVCFSLLDFAGWVALSTLSTHAIE